MSGLDAIAAIASATTGAPRDIALPAPSLASINSAQYEASPIAAPTVSFGELIARGAASVEARVDRADQLVRAFVVDDSIPVHEVTVALEEARIAVELALQVRTRLVEAYRDIMNMQL